MKSEYIHEEEKKKNSHSYKSIQFYFFMKSLYDGVCKSHRDANEAIFVYKYVLFLMGVC